MKRIIIEESRQGGWTVRVGEMYAENLTAGEALETVARWLLTGKAPYLRDPITNAIWDLRYRCEEQKLLPAPNPGSEDWKVTGHVFINFGQIFWK